MVSRAEVLTCACREDDLAVLKAAFGPQGPTLRVVESPAELARHAITRPCAAIVLGVGSSTLHHLDVIPVIRAVREKLPIIVVGEEDSLQLERTVRQNGVFYYLVHPVDRPEVTAVVEDLLRFHGTI